MEILFWLLPPVLVTVVAMAWVSWLGREGRGEVDREVAIRRMAEVLDGTSRRSRRAIAPRYAVPAPVRDRSTGVAVRPSRAAPDDPTEKPVRHAS